MKKQTAIAGFILLAAIWVWLCIVLLQRTQLTLRTLFVIAASGIIIFVPLYRKFFGTKT